MKVQLKNLNVGDKFRLCDIPKYSIRPNKDMRYTFYIITYSSPNTNIVICRDINYDISFLSKTRLVIKEESLIEEFE